MTNTNVHKIRADISDFHHWLLHFHLTLENKLKEKEKQTQIGIQFYGDSITYSQNYGLQPLKLPVLALNYGNIHKLKLTHTLYMC